MSPSKVAKLLAVIALIVFIYYASTASTRGKTNWKEGHFCSYEFECEHDNECESE